MKGALPTSLRERCASHFSVIAAQTQSTARALSALFLSFSTWSNEVIPYVPSCMMFNMNSLHGEFLQSSDIRRLIWNEQRATLKGDLPEPTVQQLISEITPSSPVVVQDTRFNDLDIDNIVAGRISPPPVDAQSRETQKIHNDAQQLLFLLETSVDGMNI